MNKPASNGRHLALPDSTWISRAECARRLRITAMAITKLCQRGMPYRLADGMVAWPDVLFWSDHYRSPRRGKLWRNNGPHPDWIEQAIEDEARELRRPAAQAWLLAYRAGVDVTSIANRAILRARVAATERAKTAIVIG